MNSVTTNRIASVAAAALLVLGVLSEAHAQSTFDLNKNQAFGTDWNLAADWTLVSGPGPAPPVAGDTANTQNFLLRTPTSSGTFAATLNINTGGQVGLKTTGTATISDGHLLGGSLSQIIAANSTGTFAGAISVDANSLVTLSSVSGDARTLILAATLSGGSNLLVDGGNGAATATLQLTGNNASYNGAITVRDRTNLQVFNSNALGSATGGTVIGNSGTGNSELQLSGGINLASEPLTLHSMSGSNRASLRSISGNNTFGGPISVTGGGTVQMVADGGDTLNITGTVTRTGSSILWRGSGTGNISGTVNLGTASFIQTDSSTWNINSTGHTWGGTTLARGTMNLGINDALPTATNVTMNQASANNSTLDLNGFDQTVASVTHNTSGSGTQTVTTNGGALTVTGNYTDASGATSNLIVGDANSSIGGSLTVDNLSVSVNGGTATLDVAAGIDVDQLSVATGSGATTGTVNANGGAVSVGAGAATDDIIVGQNLATTSTTGSGTVDFSGASSTAFDVDVFHLGVKGNTGNGKARGRVTLASGNTIDATEIVIGNSGNTGATAAGDQSQLHLGGGTNTITTPTRVLARGKTTGLIDFATPGGTLNLGNAGNRSAVTLGWKDRSTGTTPGGTIDVNDGTSNLFVTDINLGHITNTAGGGSATGTLTVGDGSLNATGSIRDDAGIGNGTGNLNVVGTQTFAVGGSIDIDNFRVGYNGDDGSVTYSGGPAAIGDGDGNLDIGRRESGSAESNGTLNLTAAASANINVANLRLGTRTNNAGTGGTVGSLTLSGGANTVTATNILMGDSPTQGNNGVTSTITLGSSTNDFNVNSFIIGGRKSRGQVLAHSSGTGSFDLTGAGGAGTGTLDIGRRAVDTGADGSGLLDLADAAAVVIDVANIRMGTITTGSGSGDSVGTWDFSNTTNTVTADSIVVGDSPAAANQAVTSTITLGSSANNVNVDTWTVAGRKSNGTVTIEPGGTLTLDGNGNPAADLRVGYNNANTGTTAIGTFNMTGGTFNADLDEIVLGRHDQGNGNGQGTLTMNAGTVTATSLLLADVSVTGTSTNPANTVGTFNLNGGTLTVGSISEGGGTANFNFNGGRLTVDNFNLAADLVQGGGVLAPGTSPGTTNVTGNYLQNSGSVEFELQGAAVAGTDYDLLNVTGNATFNDTIDVNLIGAFAPSKGDTFDLVDAAAIGGSPTFDFADATLTGTLIWDTSDFLVDGTIRVIPEPSTFFLAAIGLLGLLACGRRRKR